MATRGHRVLARGAAALAAVVLAALAVVHLPPVRHRVFAWAVNQLDARAGLRLSADSFRYNLVTGSASLTNVRLAARGHESRPFFTAARVDVDVTLGTYAGSLILENVRVDEGRVDVVRNADGSSNLPDAGDGPAPDPPRTLRLRGLHLVDFGVRYDDASRDLRLAVSAIDAALDRADVDGLDGARGSLSVRGGVDVAWGDRTLRVSPFDTRVTFDGRAVAWYDAPLVTALASLHASGKVDRVLDAPALEIGIDGEVNAAEAATWASSPIGLAGTTRVKGSIAGPAGAPEVVLRVDGAGLTVGAERDLTASGEILVDSTRLIVNRLLATPASGGEVAAGLELSFDDGPLALDARWQGVDARAVARAAELDVPPIGARLDGTARFSGGPSRALTLETAASAIRERAVTPVEGRITLGLESHRWTLTHTLRTDGASVSGRAGGRVDEQAIERSSLEGSARVTIANLADADRSLAPFGLRVPASVRDIEGAIHADATLAGTLGHPQATLVAEAPTLELPGVGASAVRATVTVDRERVRVAPLTLAHGTTQVDGEVSVDLTHRTLAGGFRATGADARDLQRDVPEGWRLGGAFTAQGAVAGTLDDPRVDIAVSSPSVEFAGETFERLDGRATVTAEDIAIGSLTVERDGGRLRAKGRYGFDRSYALDLEAAALSWHGALIGDAESRLTVEGRFSGAGSVDRPTGSGRFAFEIAGGLAGDLIGDGLLDVTLNGDHARLTAVVPSLGAFANANVSLASPYDYRGTAALDRVDLTKVAPLMDAVPERLTGAVSLTAAITGALDGDEPVHVVANLQQVDAQVAGVPLSLVSPASVTWSPGDLSVREFVATLGSTTVRASGEWAGRAHTVFNGSVRGEVSDLVAAARAFGVESDVVARGQVSADLYATGTRGDLIASLELADASAQISDTVKLTGLAGSATLTGESVTLHGVRGHLEAGRASGDFTGTGAATVPDLDLGRAIGRFTIDAARFDAAGVDVMQVRPSTLSLERGVVRLDDVVWQALGSTLTAGGSVDIAREPAALDLNLTGTAALRVLSAFVPQVAIDGVADLDVRIGGTMSAPSLSGGATVRDGEFALLSPRIVVSELTGPVVLAGDRIELRGLSGSANGGRLTVDGGFVLEGADLATGHVALKASGMALEYPRGLRSEVDAVLVYELGEVSTLSGDVRVLRSTYTEPISLAALAASSVTTAPRGTAPASAVDSVRLNVTLSTVNDILVDNNYGRFDTGATLRIVGTVGAPGLVGRVALREGGRLYAAGRTFTLNRGVVSFANESRVVPDLDLQAQTRVTSGGVGDVTLRVQGTPDRLTTDLSSSEGASQEEIAAALLGGGVTGPNALSLLSGDILGATGRQIGLDVVRIEREDVTEDIRQDPSVLAIEEDPTTRLTISKRIRENVEFTFSQNLRESGQVTYIISYFPLRNLEFRGVSRDNADYGVGLRHQVTFGGGGGTRVPERLPAARLRSVAFEGDLAPFTEAELRQEIRTRAGDRFDFYQWQRDLDRLTALYVGRGYLEVRVRGRRTDETAEQTDATYVVRRGPRTEIAVAGHPLPESELRSIRDVWTRAVFDRFLITDAETRVRRHLMADGYLDGRVTGTLDASGETKVLRLVVQPGVRAERREVRLSGNVALPDDRLLAAIADTGLDLDGWIDPLRVADALTRVYRNEGFLSATVTTDAPRLDGTTGILPVSLVEGPQARIGSVRVNGVAASREAWVREALALEADAPYTAASVEAARARVLARYRQRGFNTAVVRAAFDALVADQPLALTVSVDEGPQQILREVVSSGAVRTKEGFVNRALRLHVGEPVNLDEWAEARRRLYDSNVFRSVDIQAVPLGDAVDGVQPVRALVTVEEYPVWRLRYGVQLDRERVDEGEDGRLDNNLGGIAELRNANLFGRAVSGAITGRVERDYWNGSLVFSNASLLGLPVRSSVYLYSTKENLREAGDLLFVSTDRGISLEQRWRRRRLEWTYGYRYERNHTYDPDAPEDGADVPFDQYVRLGRWNSALILDRRNNLFDATAGTFSSVSWEQTFGSEPAAGVGAAPLETTYARVLAQQQLFVRVGPVVLASRAIVGDFLGPDTDRVPVSDRFLTGGGTTVRGYAENSLGPRSEFTGALGGEQLIVLNQEARFRIYRWIRGVGFVDAGNVFADADGLDWGGLKVGYGVGLRIDSPLGLLRVDYGIPGSALGPATSRRANDIGSGRWYFGFGHIF